MIRSDAEGLISDQPAGGGPKIGRTCHDSAISATGMTERPFYNFNFVQDAPAEEQYIHGSFRRESIQAYMSRQRPVSHCSQSAVCSRHLGSYFEIIAERFGVRI